MLKENKIIVLLLVGFIGTCFCQAEEQKTPDTYENASVIVEALIVKVSTDVLTKAGVHPIGLGPRGLSVQQIIQCIEEKKAEIISGAKITSRNYELSSLTDKKQVYVGKETEIKAKEGQQPTRLTQYRPYQNKKSFCIQLKIVSEHKVNLSYEYSEEKFIENQEDASAPPDQFSFERMGILILKSGKPVIACATQDEDEMILLILAATIQDLNDAKNE